jgi:hypothetical protein
MHDHPTDDKTSSYVAYCLDYVALGLILTSIDRLAAGDRWHVSVAYAAAGVLVGFLGFKWSRMRRPIGSGLRSTIERIAASQRFRRACAMVSLLLVGSYLIIYLHSLRGDLDTYTMPRVLTDRQAHDLRDYLSHRETHAVTIKVNPLDQEALEYAGQLVTAFQGADWDAKLDTSNGDPKPLNPGLCTDVTGWNSGPSDPKHDPWPLLQNAVLSSHIETTCSGGLGAGEYRVFLLVGPRPFKLGDQRPITIKIGKWIERLGQPQSRKPWDR